VTANGSTTRVICAQIVAAVVHDGRSLSQVAPAALHEIASERDRAFVQACTFGVLRHYHALQTRLRALMPKPLRRKDADVEALLLVGLCQIDHMGVATHAAVSATVEGARELGKDWACRLINGVLRSALRNPAVIGGTSNSLNEFPPWMVERVRQDWPDMWRTVFDNSNAQAPLTLRINQRRSSVATYAALLDLVPITHVAGRHAHHALRLLTPTVVTALPNFADGHASVQDEAAQLAAELIAPQAGERILDACAAPGGKTAHLLELGDAGMSLLAIDNSETRLLRVRENLTRLALDCSILNADAGEPASWWDGRPFNKILLDAPCSALGVMRRHPDIRLRRSAADIVQATKEQRRLLHALWPLLADGGRLLYATCSILRAENDEIIDTLLEQHDDALVVPIPFEAGRPTRHGRQILPGDDDMDGFYYCLLAKRLSH
jgi:16S rRNA (cytosine967-C5)-methyltransferase